MREECRNIQSLLPLLTALFYLRHKAAGLEIKRSIIKQIILAKSPPRRRWRPFCLCANLCKRVLLTTVNQYFAVHFLHAVPQELSVKKSYLFCSASIEFRPQAGRDVYQSIISHLRHGPRQSKQRYGQGGIQAVCQKSCRRQVRGNM